MRREVIAASLGLALWCGQTAEAIQIVFDYRYDSAGFFSSAESRTTLRLAAEQMGHFVDRMAAIEPGAGQSWMASFGRPDTGELSFLPDLRIATDEIRVFVGTRNLGSQTIAQSQQGEAFATSGDSAWEQTLANRGQIGPLDTGPWGGAITFNSGITQWHTAPQRIGLDANDYDLFTVAAHELGHLLGIGPAASWAAQVQAGRFIGAQANAPLYDAGHWALGTESTVAGRSQLALMTPVIQPGERRFATALDLAALADIGWETAVAGDLNLDGVVNSLDLLQLSRSGSYRAGEGHGWSSGDMNGDLRVDSADLLQISIAGHYGMNPTAGSVNTIPEPVAVGWLAVMTVLAVRRRERALLSSVSPGDPTIAAGGTMGRVVSISLVCCSGMRAARAVKHAFSGIFFRLIRIR